MRQCAALVLALLFGAAVAAQAAVPTDRTIPTYHGEASRSGNYVMPGLTWQTAPSMHRDTRFDGRVYGHVYAQPLYWRPPGGTNGLIIVATESNQVAALAADTGHTVWHTTLGAPVSRASMPCGDINPVGITGTPVIDPASGSIFLDAMVMRAGTPQHLVFGLRLSDGAVLPGWPIDVRQALHQQGIAFTPRAQNQRAALTLLDGRIFVAFSGNFGDCGDYHGIVLGLATNPPQPVAAWSTRALKGGIWAPGGISSADGALFFSTGNTDGATQWGDGESVFRSAPELRHSINPRDFFAPSNWKQLDDDDLDLGSTNPSPIDLPTASGTARLLVAMGKDGDAYLLNRDRLGGIGGQLAMRRAAGTRIITSPAFYPWQGRVLIAYQARLAACPNGGGQAGLAALAVTAASRDGLASAWCTPLDGQGAPIVTTSDGAADPIVWVAGAEGDDRLHAFRGDTGAPLWTSPDVLTGLRRFVIILAAEDRLYIAGDGRVYAFTAAAR
jgi:outer membrane protein assembly factor BamB